MTTYDLIKLDARIRATILTINAEALRLHGRRGDLTEEGLRKQWEAVTDKFAPQVDQIAAEVEEVAAALEKVEGFEREHLLRTIPAAGLTAAQELALQRVLARPGSTELENLSTILRPHLETPTATVLVEEIQARNPNITDEYVGGILAQESNLYADALRAVQDGRQILGVLRQGVVQLHKALERSNVNGAPMESHNRPGSFIPSLQEMYGPEARFTITEAGNLHA